MIFEEVKELIAEEGITNAELARRMDMTDQRLGQLLKQDECTATMLERLCEAINAELSVKKNYA